MSEETELIKDRLDVAEVVGEYVQLKRTGRYFKGLCPFHNEKTPSFVVSPDKGIWHCFGACGEGGDIFSFVEKIENIEFPEALKLLAERAGVEIKKSPALRQAQGKRQRLFDLLELTSRFYHEILMNQAAGKKAKEYLTKRGVIDKTIELFEIGYAPAKWDTLQNFLRTKGYAPQEMLAAGVVGENERGKLYDRFRGRIMFPIYELQRRVVAFGGRIVPWHETGEEGKYVNSPETELYEKRRIVYNLHNAKSYLKHQTPCLVVEGYMDVVMVVQAGVQQVVASSGTAFTEEQVQQLKRFTNELHFAFDADAAGFKAAISATREALKGGLRVATVVLPEGSDPADIAGSSAQKLKRHLARTQSLVSVLLGRIKGVQEGQKKEEYLQELLPLIAEASNAVYQGELVQEVAGVLHVSESRIISQLQQVSESRYGGSRSADGEEQEGELTISREQYLLGLMIASAAARKELFAKIKKSFIIDDTAKMLYNVLQGLFKTEPAFADWSGEELLGRLPEGSVSYAEGIRTQAVDRLENSHQTPVVEGRVLLEDLKRRRLTGQLKVLQEGLVFGGARQRAAKLKQFRTLTQQLTKMETGR
ncbi:MAG: DNA primase [bacterium]